MSHDPDPAEISTLLADRIEEVIRSLALDVDKWGRRKAYCFPPWINHPKPKLEVELHPRPGKWNCWIDGKRGDALDLVAAVLSLGQTRGARGPALKWAREFLGIAGRYDDAAWKERVAEANRRRQAREAQAARELAEARRTMWARWVHAPLLQPGDHGWEYLKARGVDLGQPPFDRRLPRAIRYSPQELWFDPADRSERPDPAHVGPALLSAMTLHDGKFGSLHRIWINPERPGEKADVRAPRKMWPSSEGAAIRLWRGATNLSEGDAHKRKIEEDVVVCEGVEDGLSIALLTPELRIHAAGSLPGLLSYVPPKVTRKLVIAADNDWSKPQAQAMLNEACARFEKEFRVPVFIARSPEGKDFNDVVTA